MGIFLIGMLFVVGYFYLTRSLIFKVVKSFKKYPLNFWSPYMGSVQKLDDGKWFIGCGSSDECTARMIDEKGNILWDMKAESPYKMFRPYYEVLN